MDHSMIQIFVVMIILNYLCNQCIYQNVLDYVIKFVSDLQYVGGFQWLLRFPAPVKLTATIELKYC